MRAPICGLPGLSGIFLVGLLVVAGGCRTLRSPDGRWQSFDEPAAECVLSGTVESASLAPHPARGALPPGASPDVPPLRAYRSVD